MKKTNYYNRKNRGHLPVRVLNNVFANWFIEISPDFKDDFNDQVLYYEFNNKIKIDITKKQIQNIAKIDKNGIELYENYNQYLWSICYSIIIIFDLGVQKPSIEKIFTGEINFNTTQLRKARELFYHSFSLFKYYNRTDFFSLPNPEKYIRSNSFYIERVNGVYTAAMVFILLHEFGHQYYSHLTYFPDNDEAKEDEFTVDDYAFDKMAEHFNSEKGKTYKTGIILGLGSLILMSSSLDGGDSHPDSHIRLVRQINKMDLSETDNVWGIACVILHFWGIKYNIRISDQFIFDNYKQMFYHYIDCLNHIKNGK